MGGATSLFKTDDLRYICSHTIDVRKINESDNQSFTNIHKLHTLPDTLLIITMTSMQASTQK